LEILSDVNERNLLEYLGVVGNTNVIFEDGSGIQWLQVLRALARGWGLG
jgi:hypothetical protein